MKNTRHIGVYGVIIKDKKILLVKKSRGAYLGKYDLPGGSIEHGEKPCETLKREIMEETGMEIKSFNILDANSVVVDWYNPYINEEEHMHHIGIIYDVTVKNGKIKTDADGLDSLGAKWCSISDINKENVSPLTYEVLKLKKLL